MNLSIVIPAFNEAAKIEGDINAASEFLETNHLSGEIILVDDGSRDDTARAAEKVETPPEIPLKVIHYERHRGKGYAVRTGINLTQGKFVMFADSGLCVPYTMVLRGLDMLRTGACDMAHGSRKLPSSKIHIPQVWYRRFLSKIFRWVVVLWTKIPSELTDTQCGFKIYRGDVARRLYGECISDGFMFDIEIILRAISHGYVVKEFPIEWTSDRDSRLSLTRSGFRVLMELISLRRKVPHPIP